MNNPIENADQTKKIVEKGDKEGLWPKDLSQQEKKQLAYVSVEYGLDPFFQDMIILGSKPYITSTGLKRNAHQSDDPPVSIQLEKVGSDGARHFEYKALLWKESTPENRPYIEYGEASPEDCNSMISATDKDLKAMARTRATNRVLRLAYNINITSAEELSGYDPNSREIKDVSAQGAHNDVGVEEQVNKMEHPGEETMPFGKHKGKAIQDVPSGYLKWLVADMEPSNDKAKKAKKAATLYLRKKRNENRQEQLEDLIDGELDEEYVATIMEQKGADDLAALSNNAFGQLKKDLADGITKDMVNLNQDVEVPF